MKRTFISLMIMVLTFSLVACGADQATDSNDESSQTTENTQSESDGVEVDEGLFNVTITLSADMFDGEEEFDPKAYTEENGFKETVVNEDGSVSIIMSKLKHDELMIETKESIDTSFSELIEAEDTPYIKNITSDKDYETVTIEVEKLTYENSWDMTPFMVGMSAMIYQQYNGTDLHCEIIIVDEQTQETLNTIVYPDALEQ